MKSRLFFFITNVLISLIVGTLIYVMVRPDAFVSKWIYQVLGIQPVRVNVSGLGLWLLKYYIPDGLWAYSLVFAVVTVCSVSNINYAITICIIFETLLEVAQLFNITNGTFDLGDILVEVLFTCFAIIIIKRYERKDNNYDKKNN